MFKSLVGGAKHCALVGCASAAALIVAAGGAAANPYTLTQPSGGYLQNGSESFNAQLNSTAYSGSAGEISVNAKDQATNITTLVQTWCIDITHVLSTPGTYNMQAVTTATTTLSQTVINYINALIYNGASGVGTDSVKSAALQYAIWEVEYETRTVGGSIDYKVTSGNFRISASGGPNFGTDVTNLAQTYVNNVVGGTWQASTTSSLYEFTASGTQSLAFLVPNTVPVPEAGSLALLGAGLAGLGLVRRNRKTS